jgi:trehalose 6-phosphate phosphatase
MEDNTMINLFSDDGREALRDFVDRQTLFAFDLDGTLAPIVADPSLIKVSDDLRARLSRLGKLTSVAIVTGRACADARAHLGFKPRFLVGNHGAEGLPGREEEEAGFVRLGSAWEGQLRLLMQDVRSAGIVFENKGATLSLHYRNAPDPDMAQRDILKAMNSLVGFRQVCGESCAAGSAP